MPKYKNSKVILLCCWVERWLGQHGRISTGGSSGLNIKLIFKPFSNKIIDKLYHFQKRMRSIAKHLGAVLLSVVLKVKTTSMVSVGSKCWHDIILFCKGRLKYFLKTIATSTPFQFWASQEKFLCWKEIRIIDCLKGFSQKTRELSSRVHSLQHKPLLFTEMGQTSRCKMEQIWSILVTIKNQCIVFLSWYNTNKLAKQEDKSGTFCKNTLWLKKAWWWWRLPWQNG